MANTLELFDTPEIPTVLSQCRRVLRTGGRICVVTLSKGGKPNWSTRFYEWLHRKLPLYADCRPIYVEEPARRVGFQTVDRTGIKALGLRTEVALAEKG